MRLNQSKRRRKKRRSKKDESDGKLLDQEKEAATVASVAIWNGERVTIENRELLEEIRQADDPVEKVSSLNIADFIKAGMGSLKNPLKEGPMANFIKKYRERSS